MIRLIHFLKILDFNRDAALAFSEIKASLKMKNILISDTDLFIASIALAHKLTLVTRNNRHFSRIPGLGIDTWLD